MSRYFFPVFGALTLLLGPGKFVSFEMLMRARGLREWVLLAAVELLGFGLAFQRKWAALYFSIPLSYVGVHRALLAIHDVPFPLNLLAMPYELLLALPLFLTIRDWRQLSWGGRFF
ncbi:MAG TPA: hypothetical protein VHS05_20560 [Pyrinomonadaceae bacterium]|jgi:hypothetical protein|nr:hypothetical protein [Pyrinomonadaceae bacterium]